MAEYSENWEENEMSLYEACLDVLSCEFHLIDRKYLKDLPKHILKQIICKLSPFHLEMLETEEFLEQRCISTGLVWKNHFIKRFKKSNILAMEKEWSSKKGNGNQWRRQYFNEHFNRCLFATASIDYNRAIPETVQVDEGQPDLINKELFILPDGVKCSRILPLDMNDVVDLCLPHLSRLRNVPHTYIYFLVKNKEILLKLATVIEHYEINWLFGEDFEYVACVLRVLLKNKLKSFSLSNYQDDCEKTLRTLLKVLAKSHHTECFAQYERSGSEMDYPEEQNLKDYTKFFTPTEFLASAMLNGNRQLNKEVGLTQKHTTEEGTYLKPEVLLSEAPSDVNDNENLQANTLMSKLRKDNHDDQELHRSNNDFLTEDYLYDEIFSGHTESQDGCRENNGTIIESSSLDENCRMQSELDLTSRQIRSHCLTELNLFSCLKDNKSLNVFSEELRCFLGLQSLNLHYVGLCSFPAMYDLITSIKELVTHGSLQRLCFENSPLTFGLVNRLYDLLISSCKGCESTNKGLLRLQLVGCVDLNLDRLGAKLRTCSFCEESVLACGKSGGVFHPCKCLKKAGLECCRKSTMCGNVDYDLLCNQSEKQIVDYAQSDAFQNNVITTTETSSSTEASYITAGIESLHLNCRHFKRMNTTLLASSLMRNRSLRSISLPSCGLRTQDIANIFECISGNGLHEANTTIEVLDFRDNLFEASQDNSLCNLISRSHLVYLNLSNCGLEVLSDGVVLALSSNKFLEVLMIAGNRLGDAGLIQLSRVFEHTQKMSALNTFDLSCNRLSTSSLLHFANVLRRWPRKLREITANENPEVNSTIAEESLAQIFDSRRHKTISMSIHLTPLHGTVVVHFGLSPE